MSPLESIKKFSAVQFLVLVLSSSVLAAAVTGFLTYKTSSKEISASQIELILDMYVKENGILKEENKKLADLKREVSDLRQKVLLIESSTQNLPLPMWLKDLGGIMLALNPTYEQEFLFPRGYTAGDYVGQSDHNVWPIEVANSFIANDKWVARNKSVFYGYENVPDAHGELVEWYIIKYPRYASGVLVGIAGVAIKKSKIKKPLKEKN